MAKRHKAKYKVTRISPKRKNRVSLGLAVIGLILNVLFAPGLGSLIAGKTKTGIWQIILFFLGAIGMYFFYTIFGIMILASWVWGLVTGIKLIQESR